MSAATWEVRTGIDRLFGDLNIDTKSALRYMDEIADHVDNLAVALRAEMDDEDDDFDDLDDDDFEADDYDDFDDLEDDDFDDVDDDFEDDFDDAA